MEDVRKFRMTNVTGYGFLSLTSIYQQDFVVSFFFQFSKV